MNDDEHYRRASKFDRITRWVETWHEIRYFGKALGSLSQWLIRLFICIILVIEIWKRLVER